MADYVRRHPRHRPRGWWSLFLRFGGWTALVCGALLLVTTLFSAGALYLADRLDRSGALANAVVTGKRTEGETRLVTFTFKARGGPGRTVETEVSRAYYNAVREGAERKIRYLVEDPDWIEEDLSRYRRTGVLLRWTGLVLGLTGLAMLWLFGKAANRAVRVRRDGERRLAEVTGLAAAGSRFGPAQGRLEWREPDGSTGASLPRDMDWLRARYAPGDTIAVFRLGRHAFWEGDVGPPHREAGP
jgi:hypothetical protein